MAAKIGVLGPDQADTDTPRYQYKKSVAELLVRRLEAYWVSPKVIKRLVIKTLPRAITQRVKLPTKPYIPEFLPAAEIPGVKFVLAKTCNYQPELYG